MRERNVNLQVKGPREQMKLTVTQRITSVCLALICSSVLMSEDFMYWESDFASIVLADLTTQSQSENGSSNVTLFTSGDAEISADNSTTARLDGPTGDYLITRYKLDFDGDGVTETGASEAVLTDYDQFLVPPVQITHVADDNDVVVTLRVRARPRNAANDLADAGTYTATQTLTVSWVGP